MASASKEQKSFGCEHYKRRCMLISPCCGKRYVCRFCHDEEESHVLDRTAVTEVVCSVCDAVQKVKKTCEECQVLFGKYFCEKCRLYDYDDKEQFHCDDCGICRVGGQENFFHCSTCGCCLSITMKDNHQCRKNATRRNCPVCDKDMFSSRNDVTFAPCLHFVHSDCVKERIKLLGQYKCPACVPSIEGRQMKHKFILLCNDCGKLKKAMTCTRPARCSHCGSHDTEWMKNPEVIDQDGLDSLADEVSGIALRELESDDMAESHGQVMGSLEQDSGVFSMNSDGVWDSNHHADDSSEGNLMSHGEVGGTHRPGSRKTPKRNRNLVDRPE